MWLEVMTEDEEEEIKPGKEAQRWTRSWRCVQAFERALLWSSRSRGGLTGLSRGVMCYDSHLNRISLSASAENRQT